jgi:hypothetical protein
MWVVLLPTKDGVSTAIKNVQAAAERKSGKQLCALRTDRGGEFTVIHFKEYFTEPGHSTSTHCTVLTPTE